VVQSGNIEGGGHATGRDIRRHRAGLGIAGLAAALAAHEHGLRPLLIEKADLIGGTTSDSYGLIWVGGNHLMRRAGETIPARTSSAT
jgi:3-oxosteroid 1-dehydrogenase